MVLMGQPTWHSSLNLISKAMLKRILDLIAETLHKDFFAEKTGLAFTDPKMGELTMNAGVFNFSKESEDNTIALNFRHVLKGADTGCY